jgi:long-chain acyl-CoA synthetase
MAKQVELGLDAVGISLPQYRILSLLDAGPSISSTLADRLAVRPPSVTAVVDGLVARGLVARAHSEDDRRRVSHTLTPEGRRILVAADEAVEARLDTIARCLPSQQLVRRATGSLGLWQQALLAHRNRNVTERG